MAENQDIIKLVQALEKIFDPREHFDQRFDETRKDFSGLQIAVDAYAKKADRYFQEMLLALSVRVDRLERWILQLAKKIGVPLEVSIYEN